MPSKNGILSIRGREDSNQRSCGVDMVMLVSNVRLLRGRIVLRIIKSYLCSLTGRDLDLHGSIVLFS